MTHSAVTDIAAPTGELWRPKQVRAFLLNEFTEKTLANWRTAKTGPPFALIGNRPFYRPEDVREWVRKRVNATAAAGEVA